MSASSRRILVAYATTTEGQSVRIARHLAETLRAEAVSVDVVDCAAVPRGLRIDAYDGALLGGGVRGGRYPRALLRLLRRQREALSRTPWAFFSVCLTIVSTREQDRAAARELPRRVLGAERLEPGDVAVFPGALRFSGHSRLGGRILFEINKRYLDATDMKEDWEYTDWDEVADFARRFLASVTPVEVGAATPA